MPTHTAPLDDSRYVTLDNAGKGSATFGPSRPGIQYLITNIAVSGNPLGMRTAMAASNSPVDHLIAADADAADINIGDIVQLFHADDTLLDSVTHQVTAEASAFGFTNIFLSPDAGVAFVTGDYLRTQTSVAQARVYYGGTMMAGTYDGTQDSTEMNLMLFAGQTLRVEFSGGAPNDQYQAHFYGQEIRNR